MASKREIEKRIALFDQIMKDVRVERILQDKQWGRQEHHPDRWARVFAEEYGEASKALLEGDLNGYREETIQAIAVLVAEIECLDRKVGEFEVELVPDSVTK